ncbi:hypothetical protein [Roseibium sp. M-1]
MPSSKDYDSPMRTRRETAESKAETTRRIAREISLTETEERDAKTARLKAARLASLSPKTESAVD